MAIMMLSLIFVNTVFAGEIVKPQTVYESSSFSKTVNKVIYQLEERYPETINVFEIGKSVQGEDLLALEVGTGPKQIFINGAHHARECLTTVLMLDQIDYIAKLKEQNGVAGGSNIKILLEKVTIVFVPLVNPDGANLVLNGQSSLSEEFANKGYLKSGLFKSWKANINGVDLNQNYPTSYPAGSSVKWPSAQGYKGTPFSEPETQALKKLCDERLFDGSISYHSSGEIIFWHFNQADVTRDAVIARAVSNATGYGLVGRGNPSRGNGFKDWFVEVYKKPGLTLEISPYVGPQKVPIHRYNSIWEKNKNVPIIFASQVNSAVTRETPYIKPEPIEKAKPEPKTEPKTEPEVIEDPKKLDEIKEIQLTVEEEEIEETEDTEEVTE